MNKIILILIAVSCLAFSGCSMDSDGTPNVPDPNTWLYDSWINTDTPNLSTDVYQFRTNGFVIGYGDYNETFPEYGSTYMVDGSVCVLGTMAGSITRIDANHFQFGSGSYILDFYRKSFYPASSPTGTPIAVNGGWQSLTLDSGEERWLSFNCTSGTGYTIQWDDNRHGSGSYTASVDVSAYQLSPAISFFADDYADGYLNPRVIAASGDTTIDVGLNALLGGGGTFRIRVTSP